jgi:hypothetical protein
MEDGGCRERSLYCGLMNFLVDIESISNLPGQALARNTSGPSDHYRYCRLKCGGTEGTRYDRRRYGQDQDQVPSGVPQILLECTARHEHSRKLG